MNERLSYAHHYFEMIEIVEDFLLYHIKKSKKISLPIDKVTHYLCELRVKMQSSKKQQLIFQKYGLVVL